MMHIEMIPALLIEPGDTLLLYNNTQVLVQDVYRDAEYIVAIVLEPKKRVEYILHPDNTVQKVVQP